MSRIDTKINVAAAHAQAAEAAAKSDGVASTSNAANAQRIFQVQKKQNKNRKISSGKLRKLHSPSDISETDLQPLMGKKRDDLIAGLSRVLVSIQEYEQEAGEDETSNLCKMMLGEHVRRLTLVQGTQIVSDGLRGNA